MISLKRLRASLNYALLPTCRGDVFPVFSRVWNWTLSALLLKFGGTSLQLTRTIGYLPETRRQVAAGIVARMPTMVW